MEVRQGRSKRRNIQEKQQIEAASGGALYKKVFLKISQISQESVCFGVSF